MKKDPIDIVTEVDLGHTIDIARELIASGDTASMTSGAALICAITQAHTTNNVAKAIERLAIALENQPMPIGPTPIPAIPGIGPNVSKSETPGSSGGAMDAVIGKGKGNE